MGGVIAMTGVEICTIDESYSTKCEKVEFSCKVDDRLIKRVGNDKLNKIGIISRPGDTFTIRLDDGMKLYVSDQDGRKVTILRNSKLSHTLMRLLGKYETRLIQLQAI